MKDVFLDRLARLDVKVHNMSSHVVTIMGVNSLHMTNIITECYKLKMYINANSDNSTYKIAIIGRRIDFLEKYFTLLESASNIGMMPSADTSTVYTKSQVDTSDVNLTNIS